MITHRRLSAINRCSSSRSYRRDGDTRSRRPRHIQPGCWPVDHYHTATRSRGDCPWNRGTHRHRPCYYYHRRTYSPIHTN